MQNEYTVGSLFSGVGGIEIGFEKEGFKSEWFIENEPYAKAVLKKRFPETIIYDDVTKINFRTVRKVDVLTGGFPCQDISGAGKKVGIEGSRSSLWRYYLEAIRILRPRVAFIENVSALAIRGLNVVLADLAKIGYDVEWYNISASAVGAFHQRERIFIIAYPNRNRESDESLNEGAGQRIMGEVPNSECFRSSKQGESRRSLHPEKNKDWEASRFNDDGIWRAEPELGRVADGIPNRVDRIKCLGNAVVPQCAEVFAKAIKMRLQEKLQ